MANRAILKYDVDMRYIRGQLVGMQIAKAQKAFENLSGQHKKLDCRLASQTSEGLRQFEIFFQTVATD
jgi:hypothetical protein